MTTPTSKEPYQKPELTAISCTYLIEILFQTEGNIYKRFNSLADRLGDELDKLTALEVEIRGLSEALDKAKGELDKINLYLAAIEGAHGEVQDQG